MGQTQSDYFLMPHENASIVEVRAMFEPTSLRDLVNCIIFAYKEPKKSSISIADHVQTLLEYIVSESYFGGNVPLLTLTRDGIYINDNYSGGDFYMPQTLIKYRGSRIFQAAVERGLSNKYNLIMVERIMDLLFAYGVGGFDLSSIYRRISPDLVSGLDIRSV